MYVRNVEIFVLQAIRGQDVWRANFPGEKIEEENLAKRLGEIDRLNIYDTPAYRMRREIRATNRIVAWMTLRNVRRLADAFEVLYFIVHKHKSDRSVQSWR